MKLLDIFKEPLLHFLLIGIGFFIVHSYLNRDTDINARETIVVTRENIQSYLQFRAGVFETEKSSQSIESMPTEELQQLITDYTREEALFREGKAMQLDKNDYIARARVVQQLEFITQSIVESNIEVLPDKAIEEFYEENKAQYSISPSVTFTHVFFNLENRTLVESEALAHQTLTQLNTQNVTFDRADTYGDDFQFQRNWFKSGPEEVKQYFGSGIQNALFSLTPEYTTWHGPYRSPQGLHLVLLIDRVPAYTPSLQQVREQVEVDASDARKQKLYSEAIQDIVDKYPVKTDPLRGSL